MRKTSDVTDTEFPFDDDRVPFILVVSEPGLISTTKDGRGFEHASHPDKKRELLQVAQTMEADGAASCLLAVWPGASRSDVFHVDDLDQAMEALGI